MSLKAYYPLLGIISFIGFSSFVYENMKMKKLQEYHGLMMEDYMEYSDCKDKNKGSSYQICDDLYQKYMISKKEYIRLKYKPFYP
jgi:tricorn protease-like protein